MKKFYNIIVLVLCCSSALVAEDIISSEVPFKKVKQTLQKTFTSIENQEKLTQCITHINQEIQNTSAQNKVSLKIDLNFGKPCNQTHFKREDSKFLTVDEEDIANYLAVLLLQKGYSVEAKEHHLLIHFKP